MLSPHADWRVSADAVRDWPPCANCGDPFGNIYFGAAHYSRPHSEQADCPGYVPDLGPKSCDRCNGSGIVASPEGDALDCVCTYGPEGSDADR